MLSSVPISAMPIERFESVLTPETWRQISETIGSAREKLAGRAVWNVNSTARGGGVAEMLVSLLAYARGAGIDARWEVIGGNDPFFALTKRIHNHLHGSAGDGGELGDEERRIYEETLASSLAEFLEVVDAEDIVLLHDPQTAGLIPGLKERGVPVVWRCHVGIDTPNELSRGAWNFLLPYVKQADAYVFSRETFAWEGLEKERLVLVAPSIDAFSAKNQELSADAVAAILVASGLQSEGGGDTAACFSREDGSPAGVRRQAEIFGGRPLGPDDRVVLQVSRWDRLKDPIGVIDGFVDHVLPATDAHLVYAGPAVEAVADDPEGAEVLAEARARFDSLPQEARDRVHLCALPMEDSEENGAIVNALQRRADIVVQKSIAEGFGLTVAEGMWKSRPVVATRIGGIQDQIEDGVNGVLIDDPRDLAAYGAAVRGLLADPKKAQEMGDAAHQQVLDRFLGTRSLLQYFALFDKLLV